MLYVARVSFNKCPRFQAATVESISVQSAAVTDLTVEVREFDYIGNGSASSFLPPISASGLPSLALASFLCSPSPEKQIAFPGLLAYIILWIVMPEAD